MGSPPLFSDVNGGARGSFAYGFIGLRGSYIRPEPPTSTSSSTSTSTSTPANAATTTSHALCPGRASREPLGGALAKRLFS
jgi:hypothetical protein